MEKTIFQDDVAAYDKKALVQADAFASLLKLADLQGDEDILDIGCGPGHLMAEVRSKTRGHITGIDPSPAMIDLARSRDIPDSSFSVCSAEELDCLNQFDVIFCNSAFQWFTDAPNALKACYAALRPGGKMLMQAPGGKEYCPTFVLAEKDAQTDLSTKDVYARFKNPWLFMDTANEYGLLFQTAGFMVDFCQIMKSAIDLTPEGCMRVFESGAAEAYLNPGFYQGGFGPEYPAQFRNLVAARIEEQKNGQGIVHLIFNRIYVKAVKQA